MKRIWRYAKEGVRWYLSPSGILFGVAIALLGAGLLPFDGSWTLTLAGLLLVAVFVPYRLNRQQARGDRQIRTLRGQLSKTRSQQASAHKRVNEVARIAGEGRERALAVGEVRSSTEQSIQAARQDLAERIALSERSLANRLAALRYEARDEWANAASELQTSIEDATRELAETLAADHQGLTTEDKRLAESIGQLADSLDNLRDVVEKTRSTQTDLASRISDERNRRILSFARRDSDGAIPPRVALIVAVPRTGSTWSFDMIRSMPSVFVEPTLAIWDGLGLKGRRYPAGLSDSQSASIDLEVAPGVGAEIDALVASQQVEPTIAIEKLHPEFFGFSPQTLDHAINRLIARSPNTSIAPIYQVRNPVEVMWSFARYKQRDEAWYRQVPMEGVPGFVRRTFESLEELIALRPGFVVDFQDLYTDEGLADLFSFTDPSLEADEVESLVEAARQATNRDVRLAQQKRPFLGKKTGSSSIDIDGPDGAWTDSAADIAACQEIHERLLSLRTISGS